MLCNSVYLQSASGSYFRSKSLLLVLLKVPLALEAGLRLQGKDGFRALSDALEQQEIPNTK